MDIGQVVTGVCGLFQTGEVGVHDGAVSVEGEDEGDVDADAFGDDGGDRGQAGQGCRDFDQHVGPVDDLVQLPGLVDGGLGLVGQSGVHFDGYPAVDVSGGLEDAGEQVAGVPDVVSGDPADGVVHGGAAGGQLVELFLVGRAVLECGLEDRWVGGDPADVPAVDQVFEVPGVQALTGEVIEPQGHALRGQSGQSVSHWCSPLGVHFPYVWLMRGLAVSGSFTRTAGISAAQTAVSAAARPDRRCRGFRVPAVSGSRSQAEAVWSALAGIDQTLVDTGLGGGSGGIGVPVVVLGLCLVVFSVSGGADLFQLALDDLAIMQSNGGALGLAAGFREGEVDEQAEEDDDDHVDGDPHGVAGGDEGGGDEGGGATENRDDELVGEADARYPNRGREQLGLDGRVNGLPDAQDKPAGCCDDDVDPESVLVQQQHQRVEQHDHADGADDGEDLAAAEPVRERAADRHRDDEQDEPDDAAGEGGGGVPAGGQAGVGGQEGGPGVVGHGRRGQRRGLQQGFGVFFDHGLQSRRCGLFVNDGGCFEFGRFIGVGPQEKSDQAEDAADEERDAPAPVGQGFRVEDGGDDRGGGGRGQGRQAAGHVGEGSEQASAVRG